MKDYREEFSEDGLASSETRDAQMPTQVTMDRMRGRGIIARGAAELAIIVAGVLIALWIDEGVGHTPGLSLLSP
jgi:hypothetical protein